MPESPSPRRIAVIGGGANDEHEVSLASAAAVTRALRTLGDDVVPLTIDRDGAWRHTDAGSLTPADAVAVLTGCDAAFPVLHGVHGEDGAVAGLLTMVGVPNVSSPVRAGALGMDKWVTKTIAEALGIRTAPGVLLRADDPVGLPPVPLPAVVKPATGGSSNGVTVVRHAADFADAVAVARDAGDDVVIEAFVTAREVDIAVHRDRDGRLCHGATLEIGLAEGTVFDRDQKYDGTAHFTVPAALDDRDHRQLVNAATTLYAALGCAGVARFDFFVTADGVVLNEVNTAPGFTEQSQVPRMYAATGTSYEALVDALVSVAVAERSGR